ncbi:hypothetical protein CWS72_11700 [Telmatospirillum siberiense]|uniref:Uncharacterized protein n=2 Tax=Telmatospirillum siberiense TaxID=382514 RepID=A0A2N3PV23_9PROT|nr:hypothetical protein CWS72_11700 [Telmatospirillum siberiense]
MIDRATFDRLFGNTLNAVRSNEFGRIFKDVVGSQRGARAVSVFATGMGPGLNEMSIDTGYTVERGGELRFSQGEGCLELSIYFSPENEQVGIIELATRGGVDVPLKDVDKHVAIVAQAFDMVLRDELPPARLVPPPTVAFPVWAIASDRTLPPLSWPLELAASQSSSTCNRSSSVPMGDHAQNAEVNELWLQLSALADQQNPG